MSGRKRGVQDGSYGQKTVAYNIFAFTAFITPSAPVGVHGANTKHQAVLC